jgi:hypothetical protein
MVTETMARQHWNGDQPVKAVRDDGYIIDVPSSDIITSFALFAVRFYDAIASRLIIDAFDP